MIDAKQFRRNGDIVLAGTLLGLLIDFWFRDHFPFWLVGMLVGAIMASGFQILSKILPSMAAIYAVMIGVMALIGIARAVIGD